MSQTEEANGRQKLSGGVSILGHSKSCGEAVEKCPSLSYDAKGEEKSFALFQRFSDCRN